MSRTVAMMTLLLLLLFPQGVLAQQEVSGVSKPVQGAVSAGAPFLGKDSTLVRLANGLTVLVRADKRFPVVSTRLYVHAGSAFEKPEWAGISHLLEHMVFKGTERRPKGAISREIEAAGGYLNAATSFDYTVYINDLPARYWKLGMDVAADMAFHAALDPDELNAERQVVIAELERGKDSAQSELFQTMQAAVLANTPYSRPIIGYKETLQKITVDDIRAYIREFYQPRNMLLTVVGDVVPAEVLAEAEKIFGGYTNTGTQIQVQPIDAAALCSGVPTLKVIPGSWNKIYFSLGIPVPGNGDYDSLTLDMLAGLLGGDDTALLPRVYKYEKKLVDSISVENVTFERVGMLIISAQLDADNMQAFWSALTRDLAGLKASLFTAREMDRVRLNMEESLLKARETVSGLASHIGYFQFFLGGEQGEINLLDALNNIDENSLQRAIATWISPRRLAAVFMTPASTAVQEQALGAVLDAEWPSLGETVTPLSAASGKTEIVDLGQGRHVVLIPDETLPHMALSLTFAGGESLLTSEEQGLAALTARTLTSGTQARSRASLDSYVADRAGSLTASSGRLDFSLSMNGPSRFSSELLTLFADVINHPAFEPSEVDYEKVAQVAAIKAVDDAPLGRVFRELPPFLFPGSVFGYQPLGTPQSLESFTPEQVHAFWKKQSAQPWVLAVAGKFDREEIMELAAALPVPDSSRIAVESPRWSTNHALSLKLDNRRQAHLLMLFPTAPRGSVDTPGLQLLEEALGGMGGPLFSTLRDDMGLGYTVEVFNVQNEALGYMAFYIGTDPARLTEAEEGFRHIIRELWNKPLPQQELVRGLNHWEGEYYRSMQRLSSRASEAARLTLEGLPLDESRRRIEAARHLTPKDLRALVMKYLKLGDEYTVIALPVSDTSKDYD